MRDLDDRGLILFDGECRFCCGAVRWVIPRDARKRFVFASLQSALGRRVLGEAGLAKDASPEAATLVLRAGGRTFVRSEAVLRIARGLSWPWPVLWILHGLPVALLDRLYVAFARRRYRWFGRAETCLLPTPELRGRFVDDEG
jgi:predicted DCC family thiol-disulfide oxidoreductase YuxK